MGRKRTGSVYWSDGSWYLALTVKKRVHLQLASCRTEQAAEARKLVVVELAERLRRAGKLDLAERFCEQAASAESDEDLTKLLKLVNGLLAGTEHVAPVSVARTNDELRSDMPVREFGEYWTSNRLAHDYRRHAKIIDHDNNISRLRNWIYPFEFDGTPFGDLPMNAVVKAHGTAILNQEKLPEDSVWNIAQILHRMFGLAVDPAELLDSSPFPKTWLPMRNSVKAKCYLYPSDDKTLMACRAVALVWRVFFGFCLREGPRVDNVVRLGWHDFEPSLDADEVFVRLDHTKTGKPLRWLLDSATVEALRRWRKLCPSKRWVFPASAVPRHRRENADRPMCVGQAAKKLREALRLAGVEGERFEATPERLRLRAHDMRVTFVTLSLAQGRPEEWIRKRTGHKSSEMIARYREDAETLAEAKKMGWFTPLCDAIPELAAPSEPTDQPATKQVAPHLVLIEGGAGKRSAG